MKVLSRIDREKGIRLWLIYFGSAIVSLIILLIPFFARGNHLIWAEQAADGAVQHLTFLQYFRENGWLAAIGNYEYSFGLGADVLTSMSFMSLFDPFNIFIFILPFDIVWVYDIIILLKFLAAGAAMLIYLRYKKVKGGSAVALSLLYLLSGFIMYTFMRHLNLTSGAIYLPLMILGLEQVYQKKNPFVFIGFSFLCLINSFYMFFFNSVFVVLYAFLFHAENCRAECKAYFKTLIPSLWKIAIFYLVAIILAGFMLLPNFYAYLNAARSGSKGLRGIEFINIVKGLLSFVAPTVGSNYSTLSLNIFIFALAIAALAACNRQTFAYRVCTVVLTVGFFVPLFGYFMNIFNYSNNRWSYLLSFCILSLIGLQSREQEEEVYSADILRRVVQGILCWVALLIIASCGLLIENVFANGYTYVLKILTVIFSVIFILGGIFLIVYVFSKKSFLSDKTVNGETVSPKILDNVFVCKVARPSLLLVLAVPVAVLFTMFYYISYSAQHEGAQVYRAQFSSAESFVSELGEEEFFRTDVQAAESWWDSFNNRGVNNGYAGTVFYNSMSQEPVYKFLTENQVYDPLQNLGISGLDNRPALQSLLSVKYYYGNSGSYGFSPVKGQTDLSENENYIPFGFVYENTISEEYYLSLDPLLRQYAMLSAMVVNGEGSVDSLSLGELKPLDMVFSEKSAEKFSLEEGEKISVQVKGCAGKEIYIRFKNAAEVKENTEFSVSANGKTRTYRFTPYGSNMYSNFRDPTICLGVCEEDTLEIDLSLVDGKKISFDSVEVVGYSVSDYENAVEKLQNAPHLMDVKRNGNSVSGRISLEKEGNMFFSLPYDAGWKVFVDGKEEPLVRANSGFMAVKLSEGNYDVRLEYSTPYLKEGICCSAVGVVAFASVCTVYVVQIVRNRRNDQNNQKID